MISNQDRASILVRALETSVRGRDTALAASYTDDVRAWTPGWSASSRDELMSQYERLDDAFSIVELEVVPLEVSGDFACAEWTLMMDHTGALPVADDVTLEPTGIRVTVHGITVAEFRGEQICALRQYWDELSLFEQLGLLTQPRR